MRIKLFYAVMFALTLDKTGVSFSGDFLLTAGLFQPHPTCKLQCADSASPLHEGCVCSQDILCDLCGSLCPLCSKNTGTQRTQMMHKEHNERGEVETHIIIYFSPISIPAFL